jgi:hypothetical protein
VSPPKDCAPAAAAARGAGLRKNITKAATAEVYRDPAPQSGKQFALWMHNFVIDDVEVTAALFEKHPEWRHA